MGQIFCKDPSTEEATKQSALGDTPNGNTNLNGTTGIHDKSIADPDNNSKTIDIHGNPSKNAISSRAAELQQLEERRVERIIAKAGREMVFVGNTREANYYNDQGFAAALAQHLQHTLPPTKTPKKLPPPVPTRDAYKILSRPIPAEPTAELLHQAEAFLETTVVGKEQLFAGCPAIAESLL